MQVVDLNHADPPVEDALRTKATDTLKEAGAVETKPTAYLFKPLEADSIVKAFSVESDLSSEMTSMIVFSRVSENRNRIMGGKKDAFGLIYKNHGDRILNNLKDVEEQLTREEKAEKHKIDPLDYWYITDKNGQQKAYAYPDKNVVNSSFYEHEENSGNNRNNNMLVPIKASITIDGIGGIRVGDIFMVSELPTRYKEMGVFQVVDIQDDISKSTWSTRIDGQLRITNRG
jgi:hypothetical protein